MKKEKYFVNGKNHKRAYRRHKWNVKFKNRSLKWTNYGNRLFYLGYDKRVEGIDILHNYIYTGKWWTFLRTTGKPCSCNLCSDDKYKRKRKQYIVKEAFDEIAEVVEWKTR